MSSPLHQALSDSAVVICVGSGGVGKTTVSAALGLRGAQEGRSALVCTIDPAKRLANALGLSALGNEEAQIDDAQLAAAGVQLSAPMWAMMLDMKRSWDELITRYAPADRREQILANRYYQSLSTALAGSQEYIAMEKLWQLRERAAQELIVLDTPPTAHALDFLDAPNRVLDFMDNEAARWLLSPAFAAGKMGLKLFHLGSSYLAKTLARFTGAETLQELAEFLGALGGMNERFRERAQQVRGLLLDERTAFVLVTSPSPERLDEAVHFYTVLRQHRMRVAAIVVNRVHPAVPAAARQQAAGLEGPLRAKVDLTLEEAEQLAAQDAGGVAELRRACPEVPLVEVPRFELDVHDIRSLHLAARYLVGEERVERPRPGAPGPG